MKLLIIHNVGAEAAGRRTACVGGLKPFEPAAQAIDEEYSFNPFQDVGAVTKSS
ncbi:hypothetical protein [Thiocapsa imhoffii]|uniref:hypothetical protein n=1 Tax=Thiocapsa imhoffii TaxID=382777 RepID=UPI001906063F|nr:hypothetical protein [Thiocapsa imhoffii]